MGHSPEIIRAAAACCLARWVSPRAAGGAISRPASRGGLRGCRMGRCDPVRHRAAGSASPRSRRRPRATTDGADQPHAREARSELAGAAMGRQARLFYGGLTRGRLRPGDRACDRLMERPGEDVWLNGVASGAAGARRGCGPIRIMPSGARQLLALEGEAKERRSAGCGRWITGGVRGCDDLEALLGLRSRGTGAWRWRRAVRRRRLSGEGFPLMGLRRLLRRMWRLW